MCCCKRAGRRPVAPTATVIALPARSSRPSPPRRTFGRREGHVRVKVLVAPKENGIHETLHCKNVDRFAAACCLYLSLVQESQVDFLGRLCSDEQD